MILQQAKNIVVTTRIIDKSALYGVVETVLITYYIFFFDNIG